MSDKRSEEFRVVRRGEEMREGDSGEGLFVIEDSLGYLVNYAARAFARELSRRLGEHGVRVGQWAVLMFLWAEDGVSQGELSRRVAIEGATMVRTLDRMERDGLVRRERNPRDRRQIQVFLTERGWSLRNTLIPEAIAGNQFATRGLSEKEHEQLRNLLRRVIEAMEEATFIEKERNG